MKQFDEFTVLKSVKRKFIGTLSFLHKNDKALRKICQNLSLYWKIRYSEKMVFGKPGLFGALGIVCNSLYPAGNFLFKVNYRNTRTGCEICSKLTIKTKERHHKIARSIYNHTLIMLFQPLVSTFKGIRSRATYMKQLVFFKRNKKTLSCHISIFFIFITSLSVIICIARPA